MIYPVCAKQFTDLLESEEIPRAFSKEVLYFSIRREKSLYLLSTAVTHFFISAAWACPFSQKPSASCINSFTLSLVCCKKNNRKVLWGKWTQLPETRNIVATCLPLWARNREKLLGTETSTKAPSPPILFPDPSWATFPQLSTKNGRFMTSKTTRQKSRLSFNNVFIGYLPRRYLLKE